MARTTINLDDDLFRDAAEALGTDGCPSETVNRALRHVVDEWRRRGAVERFRALDFDLSSGNLAGAWQ